MMRPLSPVIAVLITSSIVMADSVQLKIGPVPDSGKIHIHSPDARQQLYVTATDPTGLESDVTRNITWSIVPEGIVAVDAGGLVTPLADGEATITAAWHDEVTSQTSVVVSGFATPPPVSFPNQIVPIFTPIIPATMTPRP